MLPLLALLLLASPPAPGPAGAAPPPASAGELPSLSVGELIVPGAGAPAPSARALALAARRVRLIGYVVRQEEPTPGGFWLAARPVECDEGGGGTGDLPPGSVRVLLDGEPPAGLEGPVAVTGVLEVGNDGGGDGPPSAFRLRVDRPAHPASPTP